MALAARTNPTEDRGMANDVLPGGDVLVGVSGPSAVSDAAVRRMAVRSIVFAMANPEPEVRVQAVGDAVAIMATACSAHPNQIDNVLPFPGVFRRALDVRAKAINEEMKLAAAQAIAGVVAADELDAEHIGNERQHVARGKARIIGSRAGESSSLEWATPTPA